MLVLALLWWSWVGYSWLTSVIDPEEDAVRIVMFVAMAGLLLCRALRPGRVRRPRAHVRARLRGGPHCARSWLFMIASRDDAEPAALDRRLRDQRPAIGVALLVAGSPLDGAAQGDRSGSLALALDMGGPVPVRLRGLEARARPLRRAPRPDPDHRPRRVDRRDRGRGRRRAQRRPGGRGGGRRSGSRRRCGGCTSTSSRWSPPAGSSGPRSAASRTRWRATPTPTCTS